MGAMARSLPISHCESICLAAGLLLHGWRMWDSATVFLSRYGLSLALSKRRLDGSYRLTEADGWLQMEARTGGQWKRQYSFTLQPRELQEFAAMCQYQQTSPESHFTRQRICSRATPQGRVTLSDLKLIEARDGQKEERQLPGEEQWLATLRDLSVSLFWVDRLINSSYQPGCAVSHPPRRSWV